MRYRAKVFIGKGRGRRMRFPTLNLVIPPDFSSPQGIYAGWVWISGKQYPGAFHFGPIPTFGESAVSLEVFLIDTELAETPATIEFELVKHLRAIQSFSNPEELALQIKKDVEDAKKILE